MPVITEIRSGPDQLIPVRYFDDTNTWAIEFPKDFGVPQRILLLASLVISLISFA
jgi:hypothetical protein